MIDLTRVYGFHRLVYLAEKIQVFFCYARVDDAAIGGRSSSRNECALLEAVEAEVNAQIRSNEAVTTRLMTPDEAISAGAMALFGEKYCDEVRVLSMGRDTDSDHSVELCGGTHVRALGDIQLLKCISERT